MSVIFLTSGDKRETLMRDAIAGKGYQIDAERSAFSDPEVCAWGIQDPPCLVKLHDGRAVYELNDPAQAVAWAIIADQMAAAVTAYDEAKAAADAG
jgi:hypothetical protein